MTATEILVVAAGLAIGFWAVTFFMKRSEGNKLAAPPRAPHIAETQDALPSWHEVLELSPSASADDIRGAYRRLMSQYHPDKVASAGAELQALAERKSKQIGEAYRDAMKERGIDV